MITTGEYRKQDISYRVIYKSSKNENELLLMDAAGTIVSAYKQKIGYEGSYISKEAKEVCRILKVGMVGCKAKNGYPIPFELGTSTRHEFTKALTSYSIERFMDNFCGAEVSSEDYYIDLGYSKVNDTIIIPDNIAYVKLASSEFSFTETNNEDDIVVRKLEEIALEKDITWLNGKKYYVVNDEATAEKIFAYLDNYTGVISYDTETTGLRINMFGQIGSDKKKELEDYNKKQLEEKKETIRVDRLVGIIFCVEKDVSYYFPCFNRKFKNLYSDAADAITRATIKNIKATYTVGSRSTRVDCMAEHIRNTREEDLSPDVILMERCRNIIENGKILAHNGAFEWKVGWLYNIDTNLTEDTLIMHQLMYKFRSTTSNRGEPSNLKYLSKVELGVNQLDLKDFFFDFVEDKAGTIKTQAGKKGKKSNQSGKARIDFSYMDYEGSRCYAPADGDLTFQIFLKYKSDMLKNYSELEYLYSVEVLTACSIGYMEFYGHRIDEDQIESVKQEYITKRLLLEHQIRKLAKYNSVEEDAVFNSIAEINEKLADSSDRLKLLSRKKDDDKFNKELNGEIIAVERSIEYNRQKRLKLQGEATDILDKSTRPFNLAAPGQVSRVFYDELKIPVQGDKQSVAKKVIKPLTTLRDANGDLVHPIVKMYSDWKTLDTLLSKFFDNLPYYMYPGGFIFSSYGQISTATGRMSCSKPNAQQYPKAVTEIVVPRPGYIHIDADFSQIEYRALVAAADEPELKRQFFDPDVDYHTLMAALMYGVPYALVTPKMRGDAKSFNFGIPYGMGFGSLAILLCGVDNITTREEAKEKYELYFKDQPRVRSFFEEVKAGALQNRFTETRWHRKRYYSFEDKDGNFSHSKRAMALRQAGNAVIQGTAADIFKIAVARNFMYIRNNGLIGKVIMVNLIHDEILFEVNTKELNVQRILRDVIENMELKIDGFPPLFVGAGVDMSWKEAKGKMSEIHPTLAEQLSREADNLSIWNTETASPKEVKKYFDSRVLRFRTEKVMNYITDASNHGEVLHPVIGNLLGVQFDYGITKDYETRYKDLPKEERDKKLAEIPLEQLKRFALEHEVVGFDISLFLGADSLVDEEEEDDYDEDDEDDEDGLGDSEVLGGEFSLIEEDSSTFGVSLNDMIKQFSLIVFKDKKVCGIDATVLSYKMLDTLSIYLDEHACDKSMEDCLEVVFLRENNVLLRTGLWVTGVTGSALSTRIKLKSTLYS